MPLRAQNTCALTQEPSRIGRHRWCKSRFFSYEALGKWLGPPEKRMLSLRKWHGRFSVLHDDLSVSIIRHRQTPCHVSGCSRCYGFLVGILVLHSIHALQIGVGHYLRCLGRAAFTRTRWRLSRAAPNVHTLFARLSQRVRNERSIAYGSGVRRHFGSVSGNTSATGLDSVNSGRLQFRRCKA